MVSKDDFRRALGEPDEAFVSRVNETLSSLRLQKEGKHMKKATRIVALAAALLLLSAAALAATNPEWFGLDRFLRYYASMGENRLNKHPEMIETSLASCELTGVRFTVNEALYDGIGVYLVVEAAPTEEGVMFVWVIDQGCKISAAGSGGPGLAIDEYAKRNGFTRVEYVNVAPSADSTTFDGGGCVYENGGRAVVLLFGNPEGAPETLNVTLDCGLYSPEKNGFVERAPLSFPLNLHSENNHVLKNAQPAEYPSVGVRVDSVTLTVTPVAAYASIEYTVLDRELMLRATDDGLVFEFLDENGERLKPGSVAGGTVEDLGDGRYREMETIETGDLASFATLRMRAFDCWNKTRFETVEIRMVEVDG